jgi:hypothetical protein
VSEQPEEWGGGAKDICKGGKGNDSAAKCEVEKSI